MHGLSPPMETGPPPKRFCSRCLPERVLLKALSKLWTQVEWPPPRHALTAFSLAGNCAHYQKGGWWYNACAHSNLNGVWYRGGHYRSRYQDGVYWAEFRGGSYSLKKVVMMIRPNPNTFH